MSVWFYFTSNTFYMNYTLNTNCLLSMVISLCVMNHVCIVFSCILSRLCIYITMIVAVNSFCSHGNTFMQMKIWTLIRSTFVVVGFCPRNWINIHLLVLLCQSDVSVWINKFKTMLNQMLKRSCAIIEKDLYQTGLAAISVLEFLGMLSIFFWWSTAILVYN